MKRWPLRRARFWESAPFFALLLPLVAGILLHPAFSEQRWAFLSCALGIYLLVVAFVLHRAGVGKRKLWRAMLVHVLFLCLGVFLCAADDVRSCKSWYGHTLNKADFFWVHIKETPLEKEQAWKLRVNVYKSQLPADLLDTRGEALVYLYKDPIMRPPAKGDSLLVANRWMPVGNAGNPFEFDYALYSARNNIFHQQFIDYDDVREIRWADPSISGTTEKAHDWSMETLARFIDDARALGLIQAMLVGDETNLDKDTKDSFSDTGIVHVIAISGGHIAMLFVLILGLLAWIRNKKYLWIKYVLAMPVVWFYVVMAGGAPSAARAALMFSILSAGFLLYRRRDTNTLNHLFASAFLLLLVKPLWLYAIGFQLSFVAVLSLVLFYRHVYRWVTPANKLVRKLWSVAAASIAAEVLVAPLVIYYFHSFPLTFVVSNVVAVALMGLVLILGMAILGISALPGVASVLGAVTCWIVKVFFGVIEWLQQLEVAALQTLRLSLAETLLVYAFIAGAAAFLLRRYRPALYAAVACGVAVGVLLAAHWYRDGRQNRLVVYNVGTARHIEHISGRTFRILESDTTAPEKKEYVTRLAHIGWQALEEAPAWSPSVLAIGGHDVVILRDTSFSRPSADVDYAIVAYSARLTQVQRICEVYHPAAIVVSSTLGGDELNSWRAFCQKMGVDLHAVNDGAFVLEE